MPGSPKRRSSRKERGRERRIAFDADFYRGFYPDLAHMTADEAAEHFRRHGISEGRQGTPVSDRPGFLNRLGGLGSVLEIGPFCSPVMRGAHVRYLDVLDADQLRARAAAIGMDPAGCPERIHHVGAIGDVTETFDGVVSCHSVEHQPDLVRHLEGVARILRPEGGRYHLVIPDKRYCFDHFIPESTIADVIAAWAEARTTHGLKSVVEHWSLTTHNDSIEHWAGRHGERRRADQPDRILEAVEVHRANHGYLDVHAWYFTPVNFWDITTTLHAAGLTRLKPVEIHATRRDALEFFAVLERE
jgi:SAM-dependent methyltransferase